LCEIRLKDPLFNMSNLSSWFTYRIISPHCKWFDRQ